MKRGLLLAATLAAIPLTAALAQAPAAPAGLTPQEIVAARQASYFLSGGSFASTANDSRCAPTCSSRRKARSCACSNASMRRGRTRDLSDSAVPEVVSAGLLANLSVNLKDSAKHRGVRGGYHIARNDPLPEAINNRAHYWEDSRC